MPGGNCGSFGPDPMSKPCCRRRGAGGGLVEPAALAALLFSGCYGYDMNKTIQKRTNGEVRVDGGGLYRALRRLEEQGAVVSRWGEDESGPRRREYDLTEEGLELAEHWIEELESRKRLDEILIAMLQDGLKEARGQVDADDGDE